MAYNKKLLFPSEAPVWITEAGSLGDYAQDGNAISNINLSAAEFFNSIITYSVTSGSLPVGLSLDSSTGVISGTILNYIDIETINFSVTATDTDSQTTIRDFSIKVIPFIPAKYLVIGGGGAGGNGMGGGGGGGGLVTNHQGAFLLLAPGETHTITIGAGGAGTTGDVRVDGADTTFRDITALGGGGGSSLQLQRRQGILDGNPGGSGGGSGASDPGDGYGGAGLQPSSASGGFGNPGGNNLGSTVGTYPGAGGGGAGSPGESTVSGTQQIGGAGGLGLQVNIDGNNYYWAAGGGGDMYGGGSAGGPGGIGGGGGGATIEGSGGAGGTSAFNSGFSGGIGADSNGGNAGANTGSGGGGAAWASGRGGNGGSGIVILKVPVSRYTELVTGNPQVSTNGVEIILTYTGSGTYTS